MSNPNPSPSTRFKKGDPRCWRKGRPKNFDGLRELAQEIGHEIAKGENGQLIIDGHLVTVTEAIMRKWASSKDPRLQQAFIKVAFGEDVQRIQIDVDVTELTDEELERIARGEDVKRVIGSRRSGTRAQAPQKGDATGGGADSVG